MSLIEYGYKNFVRPRLFTMSKDDPEIAHEWAIRQLMRMQNSSVLSQLTQTALVYRHPMLQTKVFGLEFDNPLGLAAGFDKYAQVHHTGIPACGWGFAEVGGFTRYKQSGNDRPRMLRSEKLESLWNFMGFNNCGADEAAIAMAASPKAPIPIGANIGKSKITPIERAAEDYCYTVERVWPHVDFITINPSSPNTPGLRSLQSKSNLSNLIRAVQQTNRQRADIFGLPTKPVGVKISPDESDEQLQDIADACWESRVDFVIATNTSVSRDLTNGWKIPDHGGYSGRLLRQKALRVQRQLYLILRGEIPLIGVSGIFSGDDLFERIVNGASLCEAYTAWPFEGPDFPKRALKRLVQLLKSHGFHSVGEAVGAAI